jgi:peptidoglycan/xylan/chitin deacetylase (PgdA/CDA1 family)
MQPQFVSLMYHNVVRDDPAGARADLEGLGPSITSYFVGEREFARQLDAISDAADVLTYTEMQRFYCGGEPQSSGAGRPLVQLTFDDGWRGTVDVAGPLLADRGLQAIVFVTTGLIGSKRFLSTDALARLPAATFHVGSHTATHRYLNELPDDEVRQELLNSRRTLEDIVGYAVDTVSIPNGAADERVVRLAVECGYRFIGLSEVHVNTRQRGPLAIGRPAIRRTTSLADLARCLRGDVRRERIRRRLLAYPKRLFGAERYRRIRSRLLGQAADRQEMSDLIRESALRGTGGGQPPPVTGHAPPQCGAQPGAQPCAGG